MHRRSTTADLPLSHTLPGMVELQLDDLVAAGAVVPAFQPIIDLATGAVAGYEALARWPALGVAPDAAFAAARMAGRLHEMDWACRLAAVDTAMADGLGRDLALFVNVEPAVLGIPIPEHAWPSIERAARRLRPVIEITERALLQHPAALLAGVATIRRRGWGLALDDVGAIPDSLAMLPLVRPDVVKLDLSLVQRDPSREQARILAGVMAYAEQTGAVILAEGVENHDDLERARGYGATLAQGWHFGRPGPLPADRPRGADLVTPGALSAVAATPFDLVDRRRVRVGRKRLLLGLSRHLENQGRELRIAPVLLSAFQEEERFGPATRRRYERLGRRCPLVAVFGSGMQATPAPLVRGIALAEDDPLRDEWSVVVVGAHFCGALIGRQLDGTGADLDRRFEFVVTHDREMALGAAHSLLHRVGAHPAPPDRQPGGQQGAPGMVPRGPLLVPERRRTAP